MKEVLKAVLIDSANQEVREVEFSDYQDIQRFVFPDMPTTFGAFNLFGEKGDHTVYYDDESLCRDPSCIMGAVWWPRIYMQPLLNNLIVTGIGSNGESTDCKIPVKEIQAQIQFIQRSELVRAD